MIIAIIHPISALTRPRPPPRIVLRTSPAHTTRSLYEKPVVLSKSAEEEAMRISMLQLVMGLTVSVAKMRNPPEKKIIQIIFLQS